MDGHWYYRAIDTELAVRQKDEAAKLPIDMDPTRIFRGSAADNAGWVSFQAVASVERYGLTVFTL